MTRRGLTGCGSVGAHRWRRASSRPPVQARQLTLSASTHLLSKRVDSWRGLTRRGAAGRRAAGRLPARLLTAPGPVNCD